MPKSKSPSKPSHGARSAKRPYKKPTIRSSDGFESATAACSEKTGPGQNSTS
jgi:hypothetical protein